MAHSGSPWGRAMNYGKLDAGLVTICTDASESGSGFLEVFVQTTDPPTREQAQVLQKAGVHNVQPDRLIFTALLRPRDVAELSELSWVRAITIAQELFPARFANG